MKDVTLGFGAMRLPQKDADDPASIDMEEFSEMIDYYMNEGFDYFDTSYAYHGEKSEDALRKALVERYPRDSFRIADKIPTWLITNENDNQKFVDIMLERLGIDYFDVLLIHNINRVFINTAETANTFEYIKELKQKGIAKKIGISFHDKADLLEEVLEKYGDAIDVVQIQLNYLDWNNQNVQSKKCHKICVKYGKEIIVMEPVKGGTLVNVADSVKQEFMEHDSETSLAKWALRFAGSQENVSIVLSGMNSFEQMKENCDTFKNFEKLSRDEHRFLIKMAREIDKTTAIDCSFCNYCVKDCEMNIPIPDFFSLYNAQTIYPLLSNQSNYMTIAGSSNPASSCSECGTCIDICTQQLNIPELLKDVAKLFEGI